jgi:hypothetical protein
MTIQKLQRGQQIQKDLGQLKTQLKVLADQKFTLLAEMTHPCSRSFESPELQELNEAITVYAMSRLNTKVKELEKEFAKL